MIYRLGSSIGTHQNEGTANHFKDKISSFFYTVSNRFSEIGEKIGFKHSNPLKNPKIGSFTDLMGSVILGIPGKYKVFDIPVDFLEKKEGTDPDFFSLLIAKVHLIHLHVLFHEIGHALAFKAFGIDAKVVIYTNLGSGNIGFTEGKMKSAERCDLRKIFEKLLLPKSSERRFQIGGLFIDVKDMKSLILAAGPLCSATVCSLEIFIARTLNKWNLIPIWAATVIKIIGLVNLSFEIFYALRSSIWLDQGDFGLIAKNDPLHFLLASAFLIAIASFGLSGGESWELNYLLMAPIEIFFELLFPQLFS